MFKVSKIIKVLNAKDRKIETDRIYLPKLFKDKWFVNEKNYTLSGFYLVVLLIGRPGRDDIYAKNYNSLIIGVNQFLCWFFGIFRFNTGISKSFLIKWSFLPIDWPFLAYLALFVKFCTNLGLIWLFLPQKSIEKAQNRSEIAWRVGETVKNQEKLPKISLEDRNRPGWRLAD